ncbi:hypothetical protein MOE86_11470 [Bacillus atrophaeus]|uniref:hypothetical protein n=1 Tax=Bacillus atrophaeus TaxID=1452 RepID=UPI00227DB2E0|nr:hypothetical protein [Bacillus atrophaeus]MCY9197322.1 hypothetical protein [Bacillus atrophaeus]
MNKYLWDLNIEEIPCGWEDFYQDALVEFPDGKMFEEYMNGPDDKYEFFSHPVKYRELMVYWFNFHKAKAQKLIESEILLTDRKAISNLIKHDMVLYHLITTWISDDLTMDFFNPDSVERDFFDPDWYFSCDEYNQSKGYSELRFIQF